MTMLGAITLDGRGAADRLLMGLAQRLTASGARLCGAVQENRERAGRDKPDMVLHLLPDMIECPITQDLGALSGGCTLDVTALETAAALAESRLLGADLVIINKFGKREVEGRGFRDLVGHALGAEIPVLVAINPAVRPAFAAYAGDMVAWLPADENILYDWSNALLTHVK